MLRWPMAAKAPSTIEAMATKTITCCHSGVITGKPEIIVRTKTAMAATLGAEAKKAVTPGNGPSAGQRDESLEANVEFQVWKSALQVTNRVRAEKRSQGSIFLLCGFIPVIWGMTLLYNSR